VLASRKGGLQHDGFWTLQSLGLDSLLCAVGLQDRQFFQLRVPSGVACRPLLYRYVNPASEVWIGLQVGGSSDPCSL
jgi:hypothetical protein